MRFGIGIGFFAFLLFFAAPFALAVDTASTTVYGDTNVTTGSATSSGSSGSASGLVTYARVGGEFQFTEYANPSTGYNWVVAVDDSKVVAYNGYKELDCQASTTTANGITAVSVGAGCNYTYYFKAISEGKTTVTMKYMRSWDSNSIAKVRQVTVVVRAANATATTVVPVCSEYWWFDNSHNYCQQKSFCGAFMYLGLRTFREKADCIAALPNATTVPVVTSVPKPVITPTPVSTVEVKMQRGWNLFSVPSTYTSLQKTTCNRERVYYYNPASGQYVSSSFSSINGPKAHWFYATDECLVVFSQKAAYRKENYKEELKAGWNMVGAPIGNMVKASKCEPVNTTAGTVDKCTTYATYEPVKISDYKGTCSIAAAYSFDAAANNWVKADVLEPKKGYFVKVSADCKMYAPDESASIPALPE